MQMVSAAKYARAERELKPARVYGTGAAGHCFSFTINYNKKPSALRFAFSSCLFHNKQNFYCWTISFGKPE